MKIVIAVNKKDLWFCRICVASIRYYYPDVEIFLLKDELNGKFPIRELEKTFNVQNIEFERKKFGWSAAKIHFYCDERFKGQKFLVLDADIVFIGKLLNEPFVKELNADVIVSEEKVRNPVSEWFTKTYFDYEEVKTFDSRYSFPGFTFNCGQIFCKGNFLSKEEMVPFFDFENYPSWKRLDVLPMVDQSMFNYLLPVLAKENKLILDKQDYMLWSESDVVQKIELESVAIGNEYPFLIHWAGAVRNPLFNNMTRPDILDFFETFYYSKIKLGGLKRRIRKIRPLTIKTLSKLKSRFLRLLLSA